MDDVRFLDELLAAQMQQDYEKWQELIRKQKQQKQSGGMPGMGLVDNIIGSGGGGEAGFEGAQGMFGGAQGMEGGSAAGGAGAGMAGVIAAIIAGQHLMSNATDTYVDGVKTNDAFSGHFGTEPWLAFAHDKLGLQPTAGERFDAAVQNKDWSTAGKRLPAVADYWADPIRSWLGSGGEFLGESIAGKKGGKIGSAIFNPISAVLKLFG